MPNIVRIGGYEKDWTLLYKDGNSSSAKKLEYTLTENYKYCYIWAHRAGGSFSFQITAPGGSAIRVTNGYGTGVSNISSFPWIQFADAGPHNSDSSQYRWLWIIGKNIPKGTILTMPTRDYIGFSVYVA